MSKKWICWFSCGATSAVAAKMAVNNIPEGDELRVIYCDTRSEHIDNFRFMGECQTWIGQQIESIGSTKYKDIWDVFEKERWLVGVKGAKCTTVLKKRVRQDIEKEWHPDYQVFGFDASEKHRADHFVKNNPEVNLITPLIGGGEFDWCQDVDKSTCLGMLERTGIVPPVTYRMGFNNANCIPCVKGGAGYFNHVRRCFPEHFARMVAVENELNVAILHKSTVLTKDDAILKLGKDGYNHLLSEKKMKVGDGNMSINKDNEIVFRKHIFLRNLDPEAGRHEPMGEMSCDLLCGMMYDEVINNEKGATR